MAEIALVVYCLQVLVWPLVTVLALFLFRKPLSVFVAEIGQRTRKISAFQVSIELAEIENPPPAPWQGQAIYEDANLIGGDVSSTTVMGLFQRIREYPSWEYLVVDLEMGETWLISRLLLFSMIFHHLLGLRCVVLVETRDEHHRRFLGLTTPERLRDMLKTAYPWLDEALNQAFEATKITPLTGRLSQDEAEQVANSYLAGIQQTDDPAPEKLGEWVQLKNSSTWEHTRWLDRSRVNRELNKALFDYDSSFYQDSPDRPANLHVEEVIRRSSPFIAMVNSKGEFKSLVDRSVLVAEVAKRIAAPS